MGEVKATAKTAAPKKGRAVKVAKKDKEPVVEPEAQEEKEDEQEDSIFGPRKDGSVTPPSAEAEET